MAKTALIRAESVRRPLLVAMVRYVDDALTGHYCCCQKIAAAVFRLLGGRAHLGSFSSLASFLGVVVVLSEQVIPIW